MYAYRCGTCCAQALQASRNSLARPAASARCEIKVSELHAASERRRSRILARNLPGRFRDVTEPSWKVPFRILGCSRDVTEPSWKVPSRIFGCSGRRFRDVTEPSWKVPFRILGCCESKRPHKTARARAALNVASSAAVSRQHARALACRRGTSHAPSVTSRHSHRTVAPTRATAASTLRRHWRQPTARPTARAMRRIRV